MLNILIVNVGKQYSVGKIKAATNKWAQPQAVLYANATDTDSLAALIGRKKNAIYAYFLKAERDRNIRYFTKAQELKPKQMIEELFGASMMVPRGMKRTKTGTDFFGFRATTANSTKTSWSIACPTTASTSSSAKSCCACATRC